MHTQPALGRTFYSGNVQVRADDDQAAREAALDKVARTAHPDRPRSDWIITKVETDPG